jgi:membrane protease YdiL (CAAX protease family)
LLSLLRLGAIVAVLWQYPFIRLAEQLRNYPRKVYLDGWVLVATALFFGFGVLNSQGTGSDPWYSLLMLVVTPLVGIHEEIVNRRLVQVRLSQHMGFLPMLVLSNIVFCLFHFGVYTVFDVKDYAEIFLAGMLLGVLYQRTRCLSLVIALHTLYDMIWVYGPYLNLDRSSQMASLALIALAGLVALKSKKVI